MKLFLYPLILILSLILVGCEKKEPVGQDDLVKRNGLYYEKFSEEPYTGEMIDWYEDGQLKEKGVYKEGLKTGLWEGFRKDGSQEYKLYSKDGVNYDIETFHENGSLNVKGKVKDGEFEGLIKGYYKNGTLNVTENYKDGKKHGLWESFDVNGRHESSVCYQNDEEVDMSFCEGKQ